MCVLSTLEGWGDVCSLKQYRTNASWVAFDNFRLLYLGDVTVRRVAETIDDALKGDATVDDVDRFVDILLNKQ